MSARRADLAERVRRLLPALWAGWLVCVAALATPSAFAVLERALAGRVAARMLALEASVSLVLGAIVLALERMRARRLAGAGQGSQFSLGMGLALGALACTVAGYHAMLPMMELARTGQGRLSFLQLHAISVGFFALKLALVLALAWRAAAPASPAPGARD
ncbi:MAG: DUF4149 domain-containing protein [Burkholderiales bacterium]|nr:DUF4149 domain-containing protein [Burkholderiales bacterium]